ncbi:MAG: hypothetical protein LBD62_02530 [Candidatus Margulisbacteria bacterium]|jgi:hypothetical protein|nr:hypothetical protein [Candidatus Margulisiibacteriota bacterium]
MTRVLYTEVKSGERLVATDITDLTFFPTGAILMMDGDWTDGRGGWYICDGRDTPYGQTPDLRDKFIKGTGSAPKTGGSNALTADMLPKHTHSVYTDNTKNADRTTNKTLTGHLGYIGHPYYITDDTANISNMPLYYSLIYIKKMA